MAAQYSAVLDSLFAGGNKALLNNDFNAANGAYLQLTKHGYHPAVTHNMALSEAMGGSAEAAMKLLMDNIERQPKYAPSFVLAAELHRRAAANAAKDGGRDELLADASDIAAQALKIDEGDPQANIVATEILVDCGSLGAEAVRRHVMTMAGIRARSSKPTHSFTDAFVDDLLDRSVHFFSNPPDDGVTSGSLSEEARRAGCCIAVVGDGTVPPDVTWPVIRVSYNLGPAKTSPGHIHVRTAQRWVAIYQAARALLNGDVSTAAVWDPQVEWAPEITNKDALVTIASRATPLSLFCVKPGNHLEFQLLAELFNPTNVPPLRPTAQLAAETFNFLTQDAGLEVVSLDDRGCVSLEDGDREQQHDEDAPASSSSV